MYSTRNDLTEATRGKMIDLLDARLADATDLQTQLKQAHWNVKGPTFITLHDFFDKINEAVEDYVDDLAERAVQLGGTAHGTARQVAKRSTLPEYPAVSTGRGPRRGSWLMYWPPSASWRAPAIDQADELRDKDTADLFTEISPGIDKWLWFVEAHLQADR